VKGAENDVAQRRTEFADQGSGKAEALIFAPHQFAAAAYRSFFPHDSPGLFAFNHAIRGSALATECDKKRTLWRIACDGSRRLLCWRGYPC
jgi:hypothetical protein